MATFLKNSAGKLLKSRSGKLLVLSNIIIARVDIYEGGDFTMANGDSLYMEPREDDGYINFIIESGDHVSAFYEWNGKIQQTGFGTIYDYSDLWSYNGSELRIYEADYDTCQTFGGNEEYYIQQCGEPLIVLRLNNGYWEQIK